MLFISSLCFAQTNPINKIVDISLVKAPVYEQTKIVSEQAVKIQCDYGKADFIFPEINMSQLQIIAVDLVFTDYPSTDDLKALNRKRLVHLFNKYPSLAKASISWKLIRQTNGASKENALTMFHGFVLYYRPRQTKEVMKTDIEELKKMLLPTTGSVVKKRNGFIATDTSELRKNYEIEPYTIVLKLPVNEGIAYLGMDPSEKENYKNRDSVFVYAKPSTGTLEKLELKPPPDSTILKVLDRTQWNRMVVVADVTASMYPFTGQLMLWLKIHEDERRIDRFVFFNDGDNKDDDLKKPGNTGGIYATGSSVFEVVEQLALKTMSNGCGGSIPENNIEALLRGIGSCPECKDVVMIADNNSPVSDMILLKQLHTPVHIIVCGVHDKINRDYIEIARATGGSVHLMERDIAGEALN